MKTVLADVLFLIFTIAISPAQQLPARNSAPTPPAQRSTQTPEKDAAQSGADKVTQQTGPAQSPTPPDYSQQAYVVERYNQSMRFENDGTGRIQTDAQIKIISESGVQALGQLKVGYSALSDKLEIAYVRVRKPDGTVVTAQESAVQDLTFPDAPVYTDYHEKHISVPALRPGDVLEYRFIRTIADPITPGQFWTSYNFADKGIVLDEQLEIDVPKDRQIKLKTKPGFEAKVRDEGDRRIYVWTHARLSDDEAAKKKKKTNPHKRGDQIPSVELTTYKSWEELGAWYASLEKDRRVPDAKVKAEADALVKGKTDDMAKVKALYDYVSRNIRYVSLSFGLGRIQPHAASEVLANGYGDCKDKNTLLAALLAAEGFHSTSVLIGSQLKLDPEVPSPSQFDHVITRVPVDGKEIWLDSTPGVAPFRMLSAGLRNKQALAIPPGGKAELVWTPSDLPFVAYDRTTVTGSINEIGTFKAHVTMIARGDGEIALRYALRRMPSNRWKDLFDYMMQRANFKGAEISNVKATDPSATDDPLQVDLDIVASNYFDWSAAESKFPLPLATVAVPADDDADDNDEAGASSEPIKLGAVQQGDAELKLTIPAKYKVHLPIGVDVKRDYAEFHSTYKYDAGQFTSKRTLRILTREIPQQRSEDFAAFRRAVLADEAQQITLQNTQPGTAGTAGGETANDLNESAVQALQNQHYEMAIELFQRVLKLEPKHKSAWNSLGGAYLGLGQYDKAAEAFQKQIEINPYDEYAYNNLGRAYERQQRYDDAVKQFQKQIEVNPLDQYAHASLGGLYVNQKKFAQAVPELEKAVDIQPKNPLLQILLGQAYIATGQTDKGMATFEKAVSLSPSPLTWNNIAYSLSEQNVQLDRAGQYADTAITAIETQLRDINMDNLRIQDLGATQLLFAVWDTKGWVEFKDGKLDTAEQYILPAWQAGGSGDAAEHMGEIYEKRGKRDQAIRYYIYSLTTESASPDARARLAALGVNDIDRKIAAARAEIHRERTAPLDKSEKGTAEFYLLVSSGKVEQVKFIKGDDNLKTFTDVLQKADIGMKFPPGSQGHVVRRVVVRCGNGSAGPCTFELLPASEVRSLE